MSEIDEVISNVLHLKKKAKNRRDIERYGKAVELLERAIEQLKTLEGSGHESNEELLSQLSDCYGIIGGIHRREGFKAINLEEKKDKFKLSFESYDKGFAYEARLDQPNSYNLLNRIISRILFDPNWAHFLKPTVGNNTLELKKMLLLANEEISKQLEGPRKRDIWAMADLALTQILLDTEEPVVALADFVGEAPPDYAYTSLFSTLEPLSKLNIPQQHSLKTALAFLERGF